MCTHITVIDITSYQPECKIYADLTLALTFNTIGPKTYVRTKGYSTVLLDPTQVESKKSSQIQWPVPSINAEPVDIFLGEE